MFIFFIIKFSILLCVEIGFVFIGCIILIDVLMKVGVWLDVIFFFCEFRGIVIVEFFFIVCIGVIILIGIRFIRDDVFWIVVVSIIYNFKINWEKVFGIIIFIYIKLICDEYLK